MIGTVAPLTIVLAIAAALWLGWRGAVPRGRRRRLRGKVLLRAILPRRVVRSASGQLDIAAFLFARFAAAGALGWALVSSGWWAERTSAALTAMAGAPAPWLPEGVVRVLVTLGLFVAYDLAYWANHVLSHRWAFLWAFHKVHHSAESLSPLTNFRVHPVDTIVFYDMASAATGVAAGVLGWALGRPADPLAIGGMNALVFLGTVVLTYLQHTHLWIAFPGRLARLLMSPAAHQLHHSREERHHGRNFGSVLAVWDALGGTLLMPRRRREPLGFGIPDPGYSPHTLRGALWSPFVEAFATLRVPRRSRQVPAFAE